MRHIKNFGELKKSGFQPKSIKEELRQNLIQRLRNQENVFDGIIGYENTVIPELERAILSKHNINLLGLRGQAKTRIARQLIHLLDEWIPVVAGSEINDDPFQPISYYAKKLLAEKRDDTPIAWLHRSERYAEKLATPDVSIADLIGDIDPIKAAHLRISYADEQAIHFGIVPRSNRCIFVINELPDLSPRIQVALFNILQEGDIQIRGFKLRFPLDIQFVFTANPEDYTNRGSIVTPLKDRIGSQILTHYPKTIEHGKSITRQEAKIAPAQQKIEVSELVATLIEKIAFEARNSEFVDAKSGVSARLTISVYETVVSAAERRMLLNNESEAFVRITDLYAAVPAINGKVELVYEGEQEGAATVAQNLISKAIRNHFLELFPDPAKLKKKKENSPYQPIIDWFAENNTLDLLLNDTNKNYRLKLDAIEALDAILPASQKSLSVHGKYVMKEFVLHALAEHSQIGKAILTGESVQFKDLFSSVFNINDLN
jgi:magnesium chelatase subunit I